MGDAEVGALVELRLNASGRLRARIHAVVDGAAWESKGGAMIKDKWSLIMEKMTSGVPLQRVAGVLYPAHPSCAK